MIRFKNDPVHSKIIGQHSKDCTSIKAVKENGAPFPWNILQGEPVVMTKEGDPLKFTINGNQEGYKFIQFKCADPKCTAVKIVSFNIIGKI